MALILIRTSGSRTEAVDTRFIAYLQRVSEYDAEQHGFEGQAENLTWILSVGIGIKTLALETLESLVDRIQAEESREHGKGI